MGKMIEPRHHDIPRISIQENDFPTAEMLLNVSVAPELLDTIEFRGRNHMQAQIGAACPARRSPRLRTILATGPLDDLPLPKVNHGPPSEVGHDLDRCLPGPV